MRISELSSPGLRQPRQDPLSQLLSQIEALIAETERLSSECALPENLYAGLNQCLAQLSQLVPFSSSVKLQIWKLSYRLWNACVDLANAIAIKSSSSGSKLGAGVEHVELRQVSADLLSVAGEVYGVPSPSLKSASFYYKTGLMWHGMKKFDLASSCFEKATNLTSKIEIDAMSDCEERKLLLDLNIARSRTAWELSDRNVSITLLNRSKKLLFESAENYRELANQYLIFGKALLSEKESANNEALKLMNEALELCEKGLRVVKKTQETLSLKDLRRETLRFIAAVHLQREEFDSVIKCVRILRGNGGDQHPSLSVLAMKGWLGLGRHGEAEKELRGMVAYFKTVGMAGIETVRSVFLGLMERCSVSASAAVRVVYKVIGDGGGGGGEGSRVRAKLAAELASDKRVVALFAGERAADERTAMHAVLWNCAAAYFRSKEFNTSAEIFEKSMLYIPCGVENRVLRAKGFRVLCLCHLGLSQLDQAQEYIDEAEKLEPNIACAFLKFKIYLQKTDHSSAITQMQAMMACTDFTTEFLSLSAHEAVACHALSVAVASLSNLLNFYTTGKPMPITEVVVLRTLITILIQDPGSEQEVLKFMKITQARIADLGPTHFFGKGEVGRRERSWIATTAWNSGTWAGLKKNYELCAEFFRFASEFYGVVVDEEAEGNIVMVCKSTILTVSAMIASEKQKNVSLLDTELKQAIELLDRAGKMMSSISTGNILADCQDNTFDANLYFIHTFNAYELYGRLGDSGSQLLVIKNFASSKACNPKHLLQIGLAASQGPKFNPEVATFTLNASLSGLLASPTPDYQNIALIIRRLITVASVYNGDADDDSVYGLYKQAYRITVGLKEGEYPAEEGKWLATTAWNRAAVPARLRKIDAGKKWMNMGLELARNVPGMETYKATMEDHVAAFEKKLNEVGKKEGSSMAVD
ncbi:hypothetical protein Nepgr_027655 [Nepenthes gracilis]|uniref:Protein ZIP4 homolog n=1 Tax=Nepenthes gracilis TaxID=150966 RepID=A0AAD3Y1E4_NEPGR|nr:hypothetical protein Nepgr_027655 [Nepenthes gracilis]